MKRSGGFHSLFVYFAKIILPIAAIILLASLFLFPKTQKKSALGGFQISTQAEGDEKEPGFHNSRFNGKLGDGTQFFITAEKATPNGLSFDSGKLKDVTAQFDKIGSLGSVSITSNSAQTEDATQFIDLVGNVEFKSENGTVLQTEKITADIFENRIYSDNQVSITSDLGNIFADSFELKLDRDSGKTVASTLKFNGNVKLKINGRVER